MPSSLTRVSSGNLHMHTANARLETRADLWCEFELPATDQSSRHPPCCPALLRLWTHSQSSRQASGQAGGQLHAGSDNRWVLEWLHNLSHVLPRVPTAAEQCPTPDCMPAHQNLVRLSLVSSALLWQRSCSSHCLHSSIQARLCCNRNELTEVLLLDLMQGLAAELQDTYREKVPLEQPPA